MMSDTVAHVDEEGQGKRAGVEVGWVCDLIDGQPYSVKLAEAKATGEDPYVITFIKEEASPQPKTRNLL